MVFHDFYIYIHVKIEVGKGCDPMSSIAYITDKQMIEYHRLHGNNQINFWKPSNAKKTRDFKKGDYLFFLAKGTEKGEKREKGILGYGKLNKTSSLTFTQMWDKYKTKNGYHSKEALEEAISKITKNHKLPPLLNCFELVEVTFFQAPVYLSEIGLEISNKIESYFYLDKDDMTITSKILEVANEIGVDMWSMLFQQEKESVFLKDAQINIITNIANKLYIDVYSHYEEKRLARFCQNFMKLKNQKKIGNYEFIDIKEDMITIYIPCLVNTNDFEKKLQYTIGHYMLYKSYIQSCEFFNEIDICILFNQTIEKEWKQQLDEIKIKYKEKLVND